MNRRVAAFTLLELLVAMGIAGLLMLACGVMLRMFSQDQQRVSSKIDQSREVRRLFDQLQQDLVTAHSRGWYSGAESGDCHAGWYVLRPLSLQAEDQAIADVCAVGYALRREGPEDEVEERGRSLVRIQRDSALVDRAMRKGREDSLWDLDSNAEVWLQGVLEFELWPVIKISPNAWQPWHPELRAMPEAVEARLVMAGGENREYQTLIHLGIDAD